MALVRLKAAVSKKLAKSAEEKVGLSKRQRLAKQEDKLQEHLPVYIV